MPTSVNWSMTRKLILMSLLTITVYMEELDWPLVHTGQEPGLCYPRDTMMGMFHDANCTQPLNERINANCNHQLREHYFMYEMGCHQTLDGYKIKIRCDQHGYHINRYYKNTFLQFQFYHDCEGKGDVSYDIPWDTCYPVKQNYRDGTIANRPPLYVMMSTKQTVWNVQKLNWQDLKFYDCKEADNVGNWLDTAKPFFKTVTMNIPVSLLSLSAGVCRRREQVWPISLTWIFFLPQPEHLYFMMQNQQTNAMILMFCFFFLYVMWALIEDDQINYGIYLTVFMFIAETFWLSWMKETRIIGQVMTIPSVIFITWGAKKIFDKVDTKILQREEKERERKERIQKENEEAEVQAKLLKEQQETNKLLKEDKNKREEAEKLEQQKLAEIQKQQDEEKDKEQKNQQKAVEAQEKNMEELKKKLEVVENNTTKKEESWYQKIKNKF